MNGSGWAGFLLQELAPTHGRAAGALRTAAAAMLATAVLLYLQMSMLAAGIYLIFLISYDAPYLTLKNSLRELAAQSIGIALALLLIVATGNAPMAHVLGIAGFTFLSAFLLRASRLRWLAVPLGVFPVFTLAMWELHLPAGQLVSLTLMQVGAGAVAIGIKIALEYLFTRRDPYRALQLEMRNRIEAAHRLFDAIGNNSSGKERQLALRCVARYAFAGQGKMISLLEELGSSPARSVEARELAPMLASQIAVLMDLVAAYGNRAEAGQTAHDKASIGLLALRLQALALGHIAVSEKSRLALQAEPLLLRIEEELDAIDDIRGQNIPFSLPHDLNGGIKPRVFRDDAFRNSDYSLFAAKLSFCATLCYVLYNAMDWPGISTACITVLIAGLSSSGTTNQKMLMRVIGSFLGGAVLGLGCQIFLYPRAETELPFLLSIFAVSFLGAWIARGAHFGYVGLQIIFSFFLVAFQEYMVPSHGTGEFGPNALPVHGFTAPLSLTQGRDRVFGILLALAVMMLVFHRLHPKRAIDRMRHALGNLLQIQSAQLASLSSGNIAKDLALRERANELVVEIRMLAESIPFEMDRLVEQDRAEAEFIQQAVIHAGTLRLRMNLLAHTHTDGDHAAIQDVLKSLADSLLAGYARVNPDTVNALKKLASASVSDHC